ncbi:unnamed protein product, partial [Discosporangium mesarthrocarpum]
QAKNTFPNTILLVGCCSDELTHRFKGRTVMRDWQRYESLRHCRWVDEVIEDAPWIVDKSFLAAHKIDFVCHDALPYGASSGQSSSSGDIYAHLKEEGRFIETERTDGISTSDIITSIIQDYDVFVRRNMERGYNARDMNVPFLKEQAIKFDMVRDKVTRRVGNAIVKECQLLADLGDMTQETITDMQRAFVQIFDRDGMIRSTMRQHRKQIREAVKVLARRSFC